MTRIWFVILPLVLVLSACGGATAWSPDQAAVSTAAVATAQTEVKATVEANRPPAATPVPPSKPSDPQPAAPTSAPAKPSGGSSQPAQPTMAPEPTQAPVYREPEISTHGAIPPGATVKPGVLVVERYVNHSARTINVKAYILTQDTRFGKDGQLARDGWYGFANMNVAKFDACGQAQADLASSRKSPAKEWNFGYTVTFDGGPVPQVCD